MKTVHTNYCCCFCSYLLFYNGRTNLPTLKKESASVWKMKKDGIKAANKHKILHIEAVGTWDNLNLKKLKQPETRMLLSVPKATTHEV